MSRNTKCRKCGSSLKNNIFLSRIKKHDWICRKCHRENTFEKWWNNLSKEKKIEYRRKGNLKRLGLTPEKVIEILKKQDYKCEICSELLGTIKLINQFGKYDYVIDHSHKTKKNRGILCTACNSMLGYSREKISVLSNAINYLQKYE